MAAIEIRNNTMSKKGRSLNNTVNISLTNNQRVLPYNDYFDTISQAEQYNIERENCNKVRLIVTINPMCSNVLFNRITEVVLNENSDECQCLNYSDNLGAINIPDWNGKALTYFNRESSNKIYGSIEFTRDTQLTGEGFGVSYKPGLDIFNNHLLRSKTFKMVCTTTEGSPKKKEFNTILDFMREFDGTPVLGYEKEPLHLYLKEEIMDYDEAVDEKLDEDNGWMGFVNTGKILTYAADGKNTLPISRVINNQPACSFIDLCPDRTLWYLTPKYNEKRNRFEKNWNYCLTYPFSSTTKNISFIREQTNSLKIYYFDDNASVAGVNACKIATFCKHGLNVKDTLNLYVNGSEKNEDGDIIIYNLSVIKVIDEYTFYAKNSSTNWFYNTNFISWENSVSLYGQVDENKYVWDLQTRNNIRYTDDEGNIHVFPVFVDDNGLYRANIDPTSNDVSFKQVYSGQEVDYYVRLFRKLPNWKFAETIPNDYTTEEELDKLIKEYSTKEHEIDSNLSSLSFAKNAYGDDISQIVFTDDIDISNLTDNLGRPLTDIFLTLIKNNAGYREWYGKNGSEINVTSSTVEYSHVFGKVSCAFELSPATALNPSHQNIIQTNNVNGSSCYKGLDINSIMSDITRPDVIESDEIEFNTLYDRSGNKIYDGDTVFYGDLCLYSPATVAETVIDDIWYRFNTAQRELAFTDTAREYLDSLTYDDILTDDYDSGGFSHRVIPIEGACVSPEGYKYHPHYRIPIKSISRELYKETPHIVDIIGVTYNDGRYILTTNYESYNELNDKFIVYNPNKDEYYKGKVVKVITPKMFECELRPEIEPGVLSMFDEGKTYKVVRKQQTIPSGATLLKDGSLQYVWREIKQNGFDAYSVNEQYPFTNGAFYIEKDIRFFVKRQDPDKILKGVFISDVSDVDPKHQSILDNDDYYNEMNCFTEPDFSELRVRNAANQAQNIANNLYRK